MLKGQTKREALLNIARSLDKLGGRANLNLKINTYENSYTKDENGKKVKCEPVYMEYASIAVHKSYHYQTDTYPNELTAEIYLPGERKLRIWKIDMSSVSNVIETINNLLNDRTRKNA